METLTPISKEAVDLFLQCQIVLSEIETNGIKIDVPYLKSIMEKVQSDIVSLERQMYASKEYAVWRRMFGGKAKLTSRHQLGDVLFGNLTAEKKGENGRYKKVNVSKRGNLGYECTMFTETGKPEISEESLVLIDLPFVKDYVEYMSLQKVLGTSLKGILDEVDSDGFLHPSFNLNTVQTFRSSSDSPNFQNLPARNERLAEIVRRCFIARGADRHFVEIDIQSSEVRCAAAYHKDEAMLRYLNDKSTDMHRDMAAQSYKLPVAKVNKAIRNVAKGNFVFAAFYGASWKSMADALWNVPRIQQIKLDDGTLLSDHLESVGFDRLGIIDANDVPEPGSFYEHIKDVEYDFWNNRFAVYGQWKRDTWYKYLKNGSIDYLSGFRCSGVFPRNEVLNMPIQGLSCHCLLWSLIQINKGIKKRGWKTVLVGQIHDSIVADVSHDELDLFLEYVKHVMTKRIHKHWTFLSAPMEIEAEVAGLGETWFDKKPYTIE